MAIDINLNTSNAAALATGVQDAGTGEVSSGKALTSILGGKSLTISTVLSGDLDTLVERLKNEQERTKFALLFTSLQSLSQSMSAAEKAALEQGIELSEKLEELEKDMATQEKAVAASLKTVAEFQVAINMLQTQIDLAVQEGKDHRDLVAKQDKLRKEMDEKKLVIEKTQGKINEIANEIKSVSGKISVVISSIGENTLKTIANEIAGVFEPEKAESNAEEQKKLAKEEEFDPFKPIRVSLDKFRQELLDIVAENTSDIKA